MSRTKREQHDAVVRLATELETTTAAAHDSPSPVERSLNARRTEGFLDELDEIVLDLYAITDAEERASVLVLGAPLA
jgi:hypothetical protein